jgi:NAD(P)H-dependent nitrite reductase small subunit
VGKADAGQVAGEGVNRRRTHAETISGPSVPEYPVARLDDLPDPGARVAYAGGREVALFHVGGRVYALDNACLHVGGPLAEGIVEDGCVTCPWHDWRYRLHDGTRVGPGGLAVATYQVRLVDGEVWVRVGDG